MRISDNLDIGPQLKTIQDHLAGLGHDPARVFNGAIYVLGTGLDQKRVVDRSADFDAALGGQTTCQSEHFRAIRLHRKI